MPATCVPWNEDAGVDGEASAGARVRTGEDPGDDHLRRRPPRAAAREAGGVREARGIEEGIGLVDAVVDDCDLHAGAVGARGPLQDVGADHGRRLVERERVRDARIDLRHDRLAHERRQLRRGERHGQRVEHDLEAAADARLRDCCADLCGGARLLLVEPAQIGAATKTTSTSSFCRAETDESPRPPRVASGGRARSTMTRTRAAPPVSFGTRAYGDAWSGVSHGHEPRCGGSAADERRATGQEQDDAAQGC